MKFKAIKEKQGSGTEVKDTTYVEAARWGKYRGWRYVLGLVIILFAWLVVGIGASVLVAIIGQQKRTILQAVIAVISMLFCAQFSEGCCNSLILTFLLRRLFMPPFAKQMQFVNVS